MRPEHVEAVREWLELAHIDEQTAERLLAGDRPIIETALFHCQQLAEKALKAYLVYRNVPFRRTHELVELVNLCAAKDPSFTSLMAMADDLTAYAMTFRYPTDVPTPSPEQARERLAWARDIWAFVLHRLPPDVRA